jgi:hypothetical protein
MMQRILVCLLAVPLTMVALTLAHAGHHESSDDAENVFAAAGQNLTAEEKRNLEAVKGWAEAWENDVGRMVDDFYSDQPEIYLPIQKEYWVKRGQSKEPWRTAEVEERMLEKRVHPNVSFKMNFERVLIQGNTVAILSKGARSAIFLEFDENGKIDTDRSFFPGPTLDEMLEDPKLLMSGTRVPGGRTPAFQAALEKMAESNR